MPGQNESRLCMNTYLFCKKFAQLDVVPAQLHSYVVQSLHTSLLLGLGVHTWWQDGIDPLET